MSYLVLIASLGVVTLGAEVLVRSASVVALRAGVSALFVGLPIVGISAMVAPQVVSPELLRIDIPLMTLALLALVPIMRAGHSISRAEGVGLFLGYCAYLTYLRVARTG